MTRTCRVCLLVKELEEFPKAAHGKDGRRNQCSECRKIYHRMNSKKHYARTRTEKLAKVKAYTASNRERKAAWNKAYRSREAYREKRKRDSKILRQTQEYKLYFANYMRIRLSRERSAPGKVTKQHLKWRWDYYSGLCYLCKTTATEFDHVIPLTKGGTNWPANLKPICRTCNARKSNTWPYDIKAVHLV